MITVVTWAWNGGRDYRPEHARALALMMRRWMKADYRFVAFTDADPAPSPEKGLIEFRPIPPAALALAHVRTPEAIRFPTSYFRLWLFSAEAAESGIGERIIMTDVDAVVTGDWSGLAEAAGDFVGWRPGQTWGTNERRLAGGQWMLRMGSRIDVWEDFIRDPARAVAEARAAGYRGSDQAWISYRLAGSPVWPADAGIYTVSDLLRTNRGRVASIPADSRVVHFKGGFHPWDLATWTMHPWLANYWPAENLT